MWSAAVNLQRLAFGFPRLSATPYRSIMEQLGKCFKKRDRVAAIKLPDLPKMLSMIPSCDFTSFICLFLFWLAMALCLRTGELWLFDVKYLNAARTLLPWPNSLMQNGVRKGRLRRVYPTALPLLNVLSYLGTNPARRIPRNFLQKFLNKHLDCSLNSARQLLGPTLF